MVYTPICGVENTIYTKYDIPITDERREAMKLSIREWRRIKEISQEEMAKLCDVHPNTYRAWEENPSEIKIGKALLIAERFGISLNDIILP